MMPSIFGEDLFDRFFGRGFDLFPALPNGTPAGSRQARDLMKTDVRETEGSYELEIDLPGFKKEEVHVDLQNGYLSISAAKTVNNEEKGSEGQYIRQERCTGSCSRSFYVGDGIEPKDVSAKFEDGILKLALPKREQKQLPETTAIAIE